MLFRILTLLFFFTSSHALEYQISFDNIPLGSLPSTWKAEATQPNTTMAVWKVSQKQDENRVLTLKKAGDSMFNLCYTKEFIFKNTEISVDFHANSGVIDQGGGIMWRVQDSNNYYVVRFNPLEDNFRFYVVSQGMRHQLASATIKLSKGWHRMKIIQKDAQFEGYLDGKKLLEAKDTTIQHAGGVGVWTKADAATSFDNFFVKELP